MTSKSERYNVGPAVLLVLLWMPIGAYVSGWTFKTLWDWFVVPLGFRTILIAHAWGLSLFIGYLKFRRSDIKNEQDDALAEALGGIVASLLMVGMTLMFAFIAKSLM